MAELYTDFLFFRDEDKFEDIRAEVTVSKPVSLHTTLYGTFLWQKDSQEELLEYYRRIGIGIFHIFNSTWSLRQLFSIDYNDGDDFGSYTQVNCTPNDYWNFSISYDSFTTDVPLRARVFGIDSNKIDAFIAYRESEWRSYSLLFTHMEFSDGNKREQGLLNYEQGLFVKDDWKMRLFLELYASSNSKDDAPYFNPDHDWSLSATHMTEQILRRIYRKAFIHRLYLTLGTYKQDGYSHELIWTARYQQEHDFSDTHALVWGLDVGRRAYDGEPVHSYGLNVTYRWRF
jgi:biofilm PGA synthesis protein PgaA